ncbi:hypothetical protein WR25_22207 [Diploscapter pachys]|uniref:Uncharacterized protein n=1 Tax=Diploscapter pachys TaxID=2018661 RepID=A0A2A2K6Q8_9BILA|nr:hypothetical protein WR25_22207 [Diploscapter pachys]
MFPPAQSVAMRSSSFLSCSRSRFSNGSAKKASQRDWIRASVARNAASTDASSATTADGSSSPQCVFSAGPKYTGQASPAALSQTVMTMSGGQCSNASLPLLLSPSIGIPACCNVVRLRGNTWPFGKLPELTASNP